MQRRNSTRHVKAARARWHAAELRAEQERAQGMPDRPPIEDVRQPFVMPLGHLGWRDVRLEPRRGYVAWRCADAVSGEVLHAAALKELLRWIATQLPRMLAMRNFEGM